MWKNPYATITDAQGRFVVDRGAVLDTKGWTVDYEQNLFAPLHVDTVDDFEAVGELRTQGAARIAAPHSSTALAVNMFDVWRGHSLEPLSEALRTHVVQISGYEVVHGFGFKRGAQPDIEFDASGGTHLAVEVKLREPYGSVSNQFADRYFDTAGLWDGLPSLQALAVGIRDGDVTFTTLHVAQLVKHALGLTHSYGTEFVLGYLWHYVPSKIGDIHFAELERFADIASADIEFAPLTVTELLERLDAEQIDPAWLDYMKTRYIRPFTLDVEHAEE